MRGRLDQYRHLDKEDGVSMSVDEAARQVVRLNYGVHRMLSAIVRHRREKALDDFTREANKEGKEWMLHDELADAIEGLLVQRGLY